MHTISKMSPVTIGSHQHRIICFVGCRLASLDVMRVACVDRPQLTLAAFPPSTRATLAMLICLLMLTGRE